MDDKDLKVQEIICQELSLPFINLPVPGQASSQVQNGTNASNAEASGNQPIRNGGSDSTSDVVREATEGVNQGHLYQDSNILYHFRDMQRRQVEFIKKRVLLLEKGLNAEYQKEYFVSLLNEESAYLSAILSMQFFYINCLKIAKKFPSLILVLFHAWNHFLECFFFF